MSQILGGAIGGEEREDLLELLAVHNRLSLSTGSSDIEVSRVSAYFPRLVSLIRLLWDDSWAETVKMKRIEFGD